MKFKNLLPGILFLTLVGKGLSFQPLVQSSLNTGFKTGELFGSRESENKLPGFQTSGNKLTGFQEFKEGNNEGPPTHTMFGFKVLESKTSGAAKKLPGFDVSQNKMPGFIEMETPSLNPPKTKTSETKSPGFGTPKLPDVKLSHDKVIVPLSVIEKPGSENSLEINKLGQFTLGEIADTSTQQEKAPFKANKRQCIMSCKTEKTCIEATYCPQKLNSSCPTGSPDCATMTSKTGTCHMLSDSTRKISGPKDKSCQHIHVKSSSKTQNENVSDEKPKADPSNNNNRTTTVKENRISTTTSSLIKDKNGTATTTKPVTTTTTNTTETTTEEVIFIDAFNGGDDIERGIEQSAGQWTSGNQPPPQRPRQRDYGHRSSGSSRRRSYDSSGRRSYDSSGRRSYDSSGRSRRPYDSSGRSRSPYEGSGRPRSPYDSSGRPRSPYDSSGRHRSPYHSSGRSRSPYESSGRSRSPYDSSGRSRSPYDSSGRSRSPYRSQSSSSSSGDDSYSAMMSFFSLFGR